MNGYRVDPGLLEGLAGTLRNAGNSLLDAGGPPPPPDAGELSGQMGELMAAFVDGAAELVTGAVAAGDAVAAGGTSYADNEVAAANQLPR
ncbi:hypothetical protein [Qaidamihabitans albus]|uniref:hypothetical protein n=1 Tax=Qaidamihabitans albus TaxID=2795733 RepID=UPI0018F1D87C|nr:hypothetical protein [Qaidamihabitans albus]